MKINISKEALQWFKEEVGVEAGSNVKFFAKIYGSSPVQENFALGFSVEEPLDAAVSTEVDGIQFYVDETDLWFFNGHDLYVEYNESYDEVEFKYIKP
ncbi:HesB/YadR/YfhF family protein [Bacillus sp. FJAT-18017]|uniref:HesB/YadR/YfhF family protein n=1 Tax=Bacillus sp. FJAT-18017 TaxID=1705566 RepID=UPI0006AE6835|nr:HesB/YadR/YfhF family protein [Bacillus sp. FJAT-18017]ALC91274.1 HesB/YadR/YfhF family protein [Bacillus sp. FJAT-18017]